MGSELMKWRHFPLATLLVGSAWYATQITATQYLEGFDAYEYTMPKVAVFFLVALPAIGFQYVENRHIWSRFLNLNDNLSFFGISIGCAVGLIISLTMY